MVLLTREMGCVVGLERTRAQAGFSSSSVRDVWDSMEKVLFVMWRGEDAPTENADPAPVNAMRKTLTESASRDPPATRTRLMGRAEEETCAKETAVSESDSALDVQ